MDSYNYINDEGIQHADKPEDEERFQALRAECVDTNMLEFRELILR